MIFFVPPLRGWTPTQGLAGTHAATGHPQATWNSHPQGYRTTGCGHCPRSSVRCSLLPSPKVLGKGQTWGCVGGGPSGGGGRKTDARWRRERDPDRPHVLVSFRRERPGPCGQLQLQAEAPVELEGHAGRGISAPSRLPPSSSRSPVCSAGWKFTFNVIKQQCPSQPGCSQALLKEFIHSEGVHCGPPPPDQGLRQLSGPWDVA